MFKRLFLLSLIAAILTGSFCAGFCLTKVDCCCSDDSCCYIDSAASSDYMGINSDFVYIPKDSSCALNNPISFYPSFLYKIKDVPVSCYSILIRDIHPSHGPPA